MHLYNKGLKLSLIPLMFSSVIFALDCENMPVGFHEFAIVGVNNHVYFSHYSKFSSVHSYQVLLEMQLKSDSYNAQQKFLDSLKDIPVGYACSFSPYRYKSPEPNREKEQDDWVLPEKAVEGVVINGDIHCNIDQKDVTLEYNVQAQVTKVIQNRLMLPGDTRPEKLSYILFGDRDGAYLAHYLSAPPNPGEQIGDFDQLLQIKIVDGELQDGNTVYSVDRQNVKSARLIPGETASLTAANGERITVKVISQALLDDIETDR